MMQPFNFHSHTWRCGHATPDYSDEDYVRDYVKLGLDAMAFTDHAPNRLNEYAGMRMSYAMLPDYLQSVCALRDAYKGKIRIYAGLEAEYAPQIEDELRAWHEQLDVLVLGQHFFTREDGSVRPFGTPMDEQELLRFAAHFRAACEKRLVDIVAHPDILMLWQPEFGKNEEAAAHEICRAACEANVPLEINLNNIFRSTFFAGNVLNDDPLDEQEKKMSGVFYPCPAFWRIAASYGTKAVFGIDTHRRGQIACYPSLLKLAQKHLGDEILSRLTFVTEEEIVRKAGRL